MQQTIFFSDAVLYASFNRMDNSRQRFDEAFDATILAIRHDILSLIRIHAVEPLI